MENKTNAHTFHIPVMGIGFTVDTPVKVAHYGITSVLSIAEDKLVEKMREFYSKKLNLPFQSISTKIEDFRAKRITAYLNLLDEITKDKFDELKNSIAEKTTEVEKYMEMLPDFSELKQKFNEFVENNTIKEDVVNWLQKNMTLGAVDVNIMTKLDRVNYRGKEELPTEYNDAHAAMRGFAMSNLNSSVVLSAGMNPRLYSYMENFNDFFPDENMQLKKQIILKVSDFRSAFIQGKFLAKKGLWVSEYRVESGLNCGGHAFATDGYLLGPILEEFKTKRAMLTEEAYQLYKEALKRKNRSYPEQAFEIKITAQGGVGTSEEHQFLLNHYELSSVGWGSPFLLVPEVANVDKTTSDLLRKSEEKDLYLSNISPLGVPFNSLRGNTKDIEKMKIAATGKPGSPCPQRYLLFNTEFTEKPICTASRQYQKLKIEELDAKKLDTATHQKAYNKIIEKACLCAGLTNPALLTNGLVPADTPISVCPGPNMAFFSETVSLKNMVKHIYGKINLVKQDDRPNLFIKELSMYIDYLKNMIGEIKMPVEIKQKRHIQKFKKNLNDGIGYYKNLFSDVKNKFDSIKTNVINDLELLEEKLNNL